MMINPDYKFQAASEALKLIEKNTMVGLGGGSSIAYLVDMIAEDKDLASSLTLTSSSFKTTLLIREKGLNIQPPAYLKSIDIYFDGCDQFDIELNALKSGGGIHTSEKILASMATAFVLIGDAEKSVSQLGIKYPLVIEILPPAVTSVMEKLSKQFPDALLSLRNSKEKDGSIISDYGNYLLDVYFASIPDWASLNNSIKMIPGVVEHSLFYRIATKAIIAGSAGIKVMVPIRH